MPASLKTVGGPQPTGMVKSTAGASFISLKGIYTTSSATSIGDRASGEQTLVDTSTTPIAFGYRRVCDTSGEDYRRVNPYAVGSGSAPSPLNTSYGGITTGTQFYSLAQWNGYNQWDATWARVFDFKIEGLKTTSASPQTQMTASYVANSQSYFDDARNSAGMSGTIRYGLFVAYCGTTSGDCNSDGVDAIDPLITSSWNSTDGGFVNTFPPLDSHTGSFTNITIGTDYGYYVATVAVRWDDSSSVLSGWPGTTGEYVWTQHIGDNAKNASPLCTDSNWECVEHKDVSGKVLGIRFRTPDFLCAVVSSPQYLSTTTGNCGTGECWEVGNQFTDPLVPRAIWEACCRKTYDTFDTISSTSGLYFNGTSWTATYIDIGKEVYTDSVCTTLVGSSNLAVVGGADWTTTGRLGAFLTSGVITTIASDDSCKTYFTDKATANSLSTSNWDESSEVCGA